MSPRFHLSTRYLRNSRCFQNTYFLKNDSDSHNKELVASANIELEDFKPRESAGEILEGKKVSKKKRGSSQSSPKKKASSKNVLTAKLSSIGSWLPEWEREPRRYVRDILLHEYRSTTRIVDKRRVNIVSENLCDDIIQRMGPSLEKHKGCDIIDINPGAAVWSSKLHDFLQPRSHILMESCESMYKQLTEPLLTAEKSTYHWIPRSGIVWSQLETILNEKYLPLQELLNANDSRLQQPNNSLLVTANLGSHPKQSYRGFPSIAHLIVYQFLAASRTNSLFHRYGKIRMLLWFDNDDQAAFVPRALATRRKSSVDLEISCDRVETIVSSFNTRTERFRREDSIEFESLRRVLERMRKDGIDIPVGRESDLLNELKSQKSSLDVKSTFDPPFLDELRDLERGWAAKEFQKRVEGESTLYKRSDGRDARRNPPFTKEYQQMLYLQNRYRSESKIKGKQFDLVDQYDNIASLQRKHFTADNKDEKAQLYSELKKLTENWKASFSALTDISKLYVAYYCDNRHAFRQDPPVLYWDRREAEPLRPVVGGSKADFYPSAASLALVDFQPASLPSAITDNLTENYDALDYIITQFYGEPANSVEEGLKSLWPGSYEWILAECPDLRDPGKGGSYDLDLLRLRALPVSLVMSIVETWLKWPYRPSRRELLQKLGSEAFDPSQEDG